MISSWLILLRLHLTHSLPPVLLGNKFHAPLISSVKMLIKSNTTLIWKTHLNWGVSNWGWSKLSAGSDLVEFFHCGVSCIISPVGRWGWSFQAWGAVDGISITTYKQLLSQRLQGHSCYYLQSEACTKGYLSPIQRMLQLCPRPVSLKYIDLVSVQIDSLTFLQMEVERGRWITSS